MEVIIKLTENDFRDNLVLSAVNTLFKSNKAITEVKAPQVDIEDCDFNENVVKPKTEVNGTEKEVQKLKDFANGIYKQLNEKSQKSLKKFVEFYTDKIVNNGFRINPEKQFKIWTERDLNLK